VEFDPGEAHRLKDMVLDGIVSLAVDAIVKTAIPKLIAMFIPGAGFISAILSIYGTIKTFIEQLSKLAATVKAFLDSLWPWPTVKLRARQPRSRAAWRISVARH